MPSLSRSTLTLALLMAPLAIAGWTQHGDGSATFDAKANLGVKIHGVAKKLKVTDDGTTLTVSLALADVDTDNSLRNSHMLEDMEAEKFPTITLSVPVESIKIEDGKTTEAQAKGTFEIHGQKKEVPFKYKAKCNAGTCDVDGTADLNLKDFGVKIRSYLGVTVKPEIVVGAKFTVKK
jgi:polyisoprenoid-binding protein YceI